MDKQGQNRGFFEEHPPRERFVMYLDGELSAKESQSWQLHLSACWHCRTELSKTEESIASIMEFENDVMKEVAGLSVNKTDDFHRRLRILSREAHARVDKANGFANRFRNVMTWLRSVLFQNRIGRFATTSLLCVFIVALVFKLLPERVSAGELYKRSVVALKNRVIGVTKPIIYQKVSVSIDGRSAMLETWNDLEGTRTKRKSEQDEITITILGKLEEAFSKSGLDIMHPLSAVAVQQWSETLSGRSEQVTKTSLPNGEPAYQLTIAGGPEVEVGKITRAAVTFRESDWHPTSASYTVRTRTGEMVIDMIEQRFVILKGVFIKDEFFEPPNEDPSRQKLN